MQRQARDDEVERLLGERQCLLVRLIRGASHCASRRAARLHVDDHLDAGHAAQAAAEETVVGAQIESERETGG